MLYWRDTGTACFLAGLDSSSLEHHPFWGGLFETMVVQTATTST